MSLGVIVLDSSVCDIRDVIQTRESAAITIARGSTKGSDLQNRRKMEVVALNEQLREEFAGVVKHFLTIRREEIAHVAANGGGGLALALEALQAKQKKPQETSASAGDETKSTENGELPQPQAVPEADTKPFGKEDAPLASETVAEADPVAAKALGRMQLYSAKAKSILTRVNMYQYTTRAQFGEDVAELMELADSSDQKLMLRHLVEQQHALMTTRAREPSAKRRKVNGIRVDTVGIPGLQRRTATSWVCNLNVAGSTLVLAGCKSPDKALDEYFALFNNLHQSPTGMKALYREASEVSETRSKFDSDMLRDAMKQVKQRLPIPKHYDVAGFAAALTPHPPPQTQTPVQAAQPAPTPSNGSVVAMNGSVKDREKDKESKPSRKRELAVVTALPPVSSKAITPAAATPALVKSRTPTDKDSHVNNLRLRRLVQMKLCRHLEGREVCARMNEPGVEDSWEPMGKLEKGKVLSYSTKRHVSFSDFVVASLKKSVAACAHIYLIETNENVDSHLLVCDEFNDNVRGQLHARFKEISEKYVEGKLKNFK